MCHVVEGGQKCEKRQKITSSISGVWKLWASVFDTPWKGDCCPKQPSGTNHKPCVSAGLQSPHSPIQWQLPSRGTTSINPLENPLKNLPASTEEGTGVTPKLPPLASPQSRSNVMVLHDIGCNYITTPGTSISKYTTHSNWTTEHLWILVQICHIVEYG